MPRPPAAGQEFVVSIAVPGPVASKEQIAQFSKFKQDCNALAAKYGARVTEARLQPNSAGRGSRGSGQK